VLGAVFIGQIAEREGSPPCVRTHVGRQGEHAGQAQAHRRLFSRRNDIPQMLLRERLGVVHLASGVQEDRGGRNERTGAPMTSGNQVDGTAA
jgi:hypothetical protein